MTLPGICAIIRNVSSVSYISAIARNAIGDEQSAGSELSIPGTRGGPPRPIRRTVPGRASFGNRAERVGVTRRILADVEPRQRQSEGRDASPHVGEPAVRDQPLPGSREATRRRAAAPPRKLDVEIYLGTAIVQARRVTDLRLLPERGFDPVARRGHAARGRRRSSSRYGSGASPTAARRAGVAFDSESSLAQRLDLAQVQVGGDPACKQARTPRDFGRDARIAVAVAADPGAEADRGHIDRQPASGARLQRAIDVAQVAGHCVPECSNRTRPLRTSSSGVGLRSERHSCPTRS